MSQNKTPNPITTLARKTKFSPFALLICGSIAIALLLVWVSMALYGSSGAAQLDLSRPSYQNVREQAEKTTKKVEATESFSATGKLNSKAFDEFDEMYKTQRDAVLKDDKGFASTLLEDRALEIVVE